MDTETNTAQYHARVRAHIRARRTEQRTLETDANKRHARSTRAKARSAQRWSDAEAKADQQRRAGRLMLIIGEGHEEAAFDHAS